MMRESRRLTIISDSELDDLYAIPHFTEEQRTYYFSLNHEEREVLGEMKTLEVKAYFVLQLGYFKAKSMFFSFSFQDVYKDLYYIMQQYFCKQKFPKKMVSRDVQVQNKNRILSLIIYTLHSSYMKSELEKKVSEIVTIGINPAFVFREILLYLENKRISIPPYTILQDIIGNALQNEENRISEIIRENITCEVEKLLNKLLWKEESLYEITALRKRPKDFSYKEITAEIKKHEDNKKVYNFTKKIIPKLLISKQNINHYASLVEYYTAHKLRRMKPNRTQLYLLCFIYYRYQQINDNLVNCFIYWVDKYCQKAKDHAREKIYEYKIEANENLEKISKILGFYTDRNILGTETFESIRIRAFGIIGEDKITLVQQYLLGKDFDKTKYEWEGYKLLSPKIIKNLRPLFFCLNFEGEPNNKLIEGIFLLLSKLKLKNEISEIPKNLISQNLVGYLSQNKKGTKSIDVDKFEFFIYQQIKEQLESGGIFCSDTTKFKSLTSDLLDEETWKNKDKIIKKLGIPKLSSPIVNTLQNLENIVENRLIEVNERIKNGENSEIKIHTNRDNKTIKWSLPYKGQEDITNNPFYSQLPQVSIINIIDFVENRCQFLKSFTHVQPRYAKKRHDKPGIIASIIANGTSLGIYKMADISNLGLQILSSAEKNFIRLETLKEANNIISNAIAKLAIFRYWNINDDIVHASSDGQRFETRHHTTKSRYSSKYFGLNQGVTAYTLLANHIPVNTKMIGANEYEAHHIFDILFNNTSNIEIDWLSADMHGNNQINFALLDFINCQYAPRYTKINQKKNLIYTFNGSKTYDDYLIKPAGKINKNLIIQEWDNILRIIVSLMLKETTQSVIVKKLCSYTRKNKTKEALWEYDNIFRSIYVLNFIDDITIRRNVQKALNRGEAYHQLRRAVAIANGGKFRGNNDTEIDIWNECSRLIANCIIFYNGYILSLLLTQTKDQKGIDFLKKLSPVAWQHINLFGWYDFSAKESLINVEKFIEKLKINLE